MTYELRWLVWDEEETIIPPASEIQYGRRFETRMVTKRKLQYRQKIDVTIRAAAAGMWDNDSIAKTANYQWSDWIDVPEVVERDMQCP